jgi:lipopolysaccharide/colanic/teichoic acid biosynthesis glycosyltransferase
MMSNGLSVAVLESPSVLEPMTVPRPVERMRRQEPARPRRQERDRQRPRQPVIGEELFKGVLIRERKRTDRSHHPFLLALVSVEDVVADPSVWSPVIDALLASSRETDVLGWFSDRAVLGVLLPEIVSADVPVVRGFEARVRRELSRRLTAAAASRVSIQLYVHPAPACNGQEGLAPVDPLLLNLHSRKALATTYDAFKRGLDVLGSLALLLALSPLFLVIALMVRFTSRGPIFFRQVRIGQRARPFKMLKFRTMFSGVDHAVHQEFVTRFINSDGKINEPGKDAPFKLANDHRITPVGRLLRKTSLDELPQLVNVLLGEMSLVGPRPPIAYEVEQYQPWHHRRILDAKPGITGLWQVAGRSSTTFDEMVRLDLRYARTCSIWNDVKILLATPAAVIVGKGAC